MFDLWAKNSLGQTVQEVLKNNNDMDQTDKEIVARVLREHEEYDGVVGFVGDFLPRKVVNRGE